ncbi:MAG TPA: hypothetical protein VG652_05705 [Gaiellaceae bacterium]|nr:hypothetical protein [Gaiellaceae bacterium]
MTRMQACGRHAREIASFNDGLNPIVSIPAAAPTHLGMPRAGIYLTDDSKTTVHFAPAASLARFAGEN